MMYNLIRLEITPRIADEAKAQPCRIAITALRYIWMSGVEFRITHPRAIPQLGPSKEHPTFVLPPADPARRYPRRLV